MTLTVDAPINERWVAVPKSTRALALDIGTVAGNISRTLGGLSTTPHGMAAARRQVQRLSDLIGALEDEI